MNPVIVPNSEWLAMLTALIATGAPWNGGKVHLFQNNIVLGPTVTLANLTEADFTGYAASSAVTWGTPGYLPNGTAVVTGDTKQFQVGSTPTVFNTVYGWYLTDSTGAILIFARSFDTPVVLSAALQIVDVLPAYPAYVTQ